MQRLKGEIAQAAPAQIERGHGNSGQSATSNNVGQAAAPDQQPRAQADQQPPPSGEGS